GTADGRPGLRRRRAHQRCARRQGRDDEHEPLRLRRRRRQRAPGRPADVAGRDADLPRVQSATGTAGDRHEDEPRPGAGRVEGHRPRPRGRRDRKPDCRLQPAGLTAVQPRRNGTALSARRPGVRRQRRADDRAPGTYRAQARGAWPISAGGTAPAASPLSAARIRRADKFGTRGDVMVTLRGSNARLAMGLIGFFWLIVGPGLRSAEAQQQKYTGAASCSASNCHGSTKAKPDYPKLDESVLWAKKDRHAQAYATLLNEKLKSGVSPSSIAKGLNIAKAETSERCLTCHAVNVPVALRGPKFDISEGVHCDGCHGPAEKWLEPHAEKGWTHEQSVKVGMYDTKNLLLRAEKCVACHLQIDTDLVTAGHPETLTIELDTFSENMPPHWGTKGTWTRTRIWSLGQVISLREAAKQVRGPSQGQRFGQADGRGDRESPRSLRHGKARPGGDGASTGGEPRPGRHRAERRRDEGRQGQRPDGRREDRRRGRSGGAEDRHEGLRPGDDSAPHQERGGRCRRHRRGRHQDGRARGDVPRSAVVDVFQGHQRQSRQVGERRARRDVWGRGEPREVRREGVRGPDQGLRQELQVTGEERLLTLLHAWRDQDQQLALFDPLRLRAEPEAEDRN